MIENKTINNYPSEKQIRLGIKWCDKYNIRLNDKCIYLNNSDRTRFDY